MKLYDCSTAPSPRRVRIFLAEKSIDVPKVQVDLRAGEHLTPEFQAINPWCAVPVLELDDGTRISESTAICRYFEELQPEPRLMGVDAVDKALVTMWDRRMELDGFLAVMEALRNASRAFEGRALTGAVSFEQIPALAERGRVRVQRFFATLDEILADREFVTGSRFTIADITALCAVDFSRVVRLSIPQEYAHATRWHAAVSARPSASV